jgi:hypothetical protein
LLGSSRGSKIAIVLGTVGGVVGLLILVALFIICNGRKKIYLCEAFVDVSGRSMLHNIVSSHSFG